MDSSISASPSSERSSFDDGIHVLTGVLLLTVIGSALRLDTGAALVTLMLAGSFGAVYFYGSTAGEWWGRGLKLAWLGALTVVWLAAVLVAPIAMYLLFTLFFLYMGVIGEYFGDAWGVVAVAASIVVSVLVQLPDVSVGGVMGPAVSGGVTVAIHQAFQAMFRANRERDEVIAELVRTRDQLAETEREKGIIAERQRLAHEIHDTLAQGLSSIQMLLHVAESEVDKAASRATRSRDAEAARGEQSTENAALGVAKVRIQQARQTAADNLAEARAMIAALTPAQLTTTSLADALERIAAHAHDTAGLKAEVEVDGEVRQLPMTIETTLLRIAQGATGNVVTHSQASRMRITLTYECDQVRLDVVDNGRGFDPAAVAARPSGLGHVGLSALRQRAEERGGTIEVESAPGEGTAVSVSLPVEDRR